MATIEEKAKAYDEAIKVAENIHRFSSDPAEIKRMEQIFPELKESEDEKIRKEIKDFFSRIMLGQENFLKEDYDWNTWLAWIEKQGEQKPVCSEEQHENESLSDIENRIINFAMQFHDNRMKPEAEWEDEVKMLRDNIKIDPWSKEDEVKINRIVACLENLNVADNDILLKDVDWLKSLRDRVRPQTKQEWSEEDKDFMYDTLSNLTELKDRYGEGYGNVGKCIAWLKSLRPQNRWKPSDEQLDALHDAAVYVDKSMFPYPKGILMKLYKQIKKLREE